MKTKFKPLKLIFPYISLEILFGLIIAILWIFVGYNGIILGLTVGIGGFIVVTPIVACWEINNFSVLINELSIDCLMVDRKTDNGSWVEEIENIKSIKIATREECRNYYKNCHSKKVILIDFGNGNVKYIALQFFTKRQSKKMIQTINERLEAIKQSKIKN